MKEGQRPPSEEELFEFVYGIPLRLSKQLAASKIPGVNVYHQWMLNEFEERFGNEAERPENDQKTV